MKNAAKVQSSRNAKRKAAYAALASEQDKESRNRAIGDALGEGADNLKGDERVEVKQENGTVVPARVRRAAVQPKMPTSETRAAKRARLKAGKTRRLNPFDHPNGACGNAGCAKCHPRAVRAEVRT